MGLTRVLQEKDRLKKELDQMKSMHVYYEEKYQELISKYESALKRKMTLQVEREGHLTKLKALRDANASQRERLKTMMLERSQKDFGGSAINESYAALKKSKARNSRAKTKTNGSNPDKENQNDSQEDSLGKHLGFTRKSKRNPLLTPIPKDLPNPFVNANTGLVSDMKPAVGLNLGPVKKIKVGSH